MALNYSLRFPGYLRFQKPENLLQSVRNWKTKSLFPIFWYGARNIEDVDGGLPWYTREGFLPIQNAIAKAFIKINGVNKIPKIKMQRYPYSAHSRDILLNHLKVTAPLFIILSFILPAISTVRYITIEKENRLKDVMKIMGLPNWLHWTSWFIKTMIYMTIIVTLMVVLLKVSSLMQ